MGQSRTLGCKQWRPNSEHRGLLQGKGNLLAGCHMGRATRFKPVSARGPGQTPLLVVGEGTLCLPPASFACREMRGACSLRVRGARGLTVRSQPESHSTQQQSPRRGNWDCAAPRQSTTGGLSCRSWWGKKAPPSACSAQLKMAPGREEEGDKWQKAKQAGSGSITELQLAEPRRDSFCVEPRSAAGGAQCQQ